MAKIPRTGSGQFQWNFGAWLGAQIGGTAWMLLLGCLLILREPMHGAISLLSAALVNGFAVFLWSRRDRYEPYPCIQGLLAAVAIVTFGLLLFFDRTGQLASVDPHFRQNPRGLYSLMLMFPVLMLLFHFQNRAGRRK